MHFTRPFDSCFFNSGSGPFENFMMLEEERLCGAGLFWVAGRGQLAWAHVAPASECIFFSRVHLSVALAIKQTDAGSHPFSETTRFRTKIINTRLPIARTQPGAHFFWTYISLCREIRNQREISASDWEIFVCKCAQWWWIKRRFECRQQRFTGAKQTQRQGARSH